MPDGQGHDYEGAKSVKNANSASCSGDLLMRLVIDSIVKEQQRLVRYACFAILLFGRPSNQCRYYIALQCQDIHSLWSRIMMWCRMIGDRTPSYQHASMGRVDSCCNLHGSLHALLSMRQIPTTFYQQPPIHEQERELDRNKSHSEHSRSCENHLVVLTSSCSSLCRVVSGR